MIDEFSINETHKFTETFGAKEETAFTAKMIRNKLF